MCHPVTCLIQGLIVGVGVCVVSRGKVCVCGVYVEGVCMSPV